MAQTFGQSRTRRTRTRSSFISRDVMDAFNARDPLHAFSVNSLHAYEHASRLVDNGRADPPRLTPALVQRFENRIESRIAEMDAPCDVYISLVDNETREEVGSYEYQTIVSVAWNEDESDELDISDASFSVIPSSLHVDASRIDVPDGYDIDHVFTETADFRERQGDSTDSDYSAFVTVTVERTRDSDDDDDDNNSSHDGDNDESVIDDEQPNNELTAQKFVPYDRDDDEQNEQHAAPETVSVDVAITIFDEPDGRQLLNASTTLNVEITADVESQVSQATIIDAIQEHAHDVGAYMNDVSFDAPTSVSALYVLNQNDRDYSDDDAFNDRESDRGTSLADWNLYSPGYVNALDAGDFGQRFVSDSPDIVTFFEASTRLASDISRERGDNIVEPMNRDVALKAYKWAHECHARGAIQRSFEVGEILNHIDRDYVLEWSGTLSPSNRRAARFTDIARATSRIISQALREKVDSRKDVCVLVAFFVADVTNENDASASISMLFYK